MEHKVTYIALSKLPPKSLIKREGLASHTKSIIRFCQRKLFGFFSTHQSHTSALSHYPLDPLCHPCTSTPPSSHITKQTHKCSTILTPINRRDLIDLTITQTPPPHSRQPCLSHPTHRNHSQEPNTHAPPPTTTTTHIHTHKNKCQAYLPFEPTCLNL